MCFFDPPGDTHAILNRDVAITLAGTIATTKAAKKDWQELDLRAALNREGSDQDLRCDRGGFAFRKASVYHDHDGQPWENTVASAVQWVDRELPFAAALAADILERRWEDVCDFAVSLINDLTIRSALTTSDEHERTTNA